MKPIKYHTLNSIYFKYKQVHNQRPFEGEQGLYLDGYRGKIARVGDGRNDERHDLAVLLLKSTLDFVVCKRKFGLFHCSQIKLWASWKSGGGTTVRKSECFLSTKISFEFMQIFVNS